MGSGWSHPSLVTNLAGCNGAERSGGIAVSLAAIVFPLEGLQVSEIVCSVLGYRLNVVNLPPCAVVGGISVLCPINPRAANILATHSRVNAGNDGCLIPYGNFG